MTIHTYRHIGAWWVVGLYVPSTNAPGIAHWLEVKRFPNERAAADYVRLLNGGSDA